MRDCHNRGTNSKKMMDGIIIFMMQMGPGEKE